MNAPILTGHKGEWRGEEQEKAAGRRTNGTHLSFEDKLSSEITSSGPNKALKTTLRVEIDQEAWESLYSDTSHPFDKPSSGRIAVKVINYLGDEVMKVFGAG